MRHPLDPRPLHVFAETLGTIDAMGLLREGEASQEIVAAIERLPESAIVNRSGLRARLHHAMHDAGDAYRLQRSEAEFAVRTAVMAAVAGNKSALIVKAVAEGARGCLSIQESHAIALDQALRDVQR